MNEKPILFSGAMVRAILEGHKTQTRRVLKGIALEMLGDGFTAEYVADTGNAAWCPYGRPGDRIWVRETFSRCGCDGCTKAWPMPWPLGKDNHPVLYRATRNGTSGLVWRPSIFMPRWASRITLEVTKVRVERVQEISEEDANAEGLTSNYQDGIACSSIPPERHKWHQPKRVFFSALWDSLNAKRGFGWDANPWVWVIEFTSGARVEGQ